MVVLVATTVPAALPAVVAATSATCGGIVFHDHDGDGNQIEDYGFVDPVYASVAEPGIEGIQITVATRTGDFLESITNADGRWSVNLHRDEFPIRIEIGTTGDDGSTFQPSPIGLDNGGTVQFIESLEDCSEPLGENVRSGAVGLVVPGTSCENRPSLATSCYLFGNVPGHDQMPAVVTLPDGADDNRATDGSPFQDDPYTLRATLGQVGSVWGLDHSRTTDVIYVASLVKRHTQLGSTGNPTTIYSIDGEDVREWVSLDPTAQDPHTASEDGGWINDFGAFDAAGKTGLGDLELSADGRTVTTVDLAAREIVNIAVMPDGSPGPQTRIAVKNANLSLPAGRCPDSDLRPFGLGQSESLLLVGVVCTAESTVGPADLPLDVETGRSQHGRSAGDPERLGAWIFAIDHLLTGSFELVTEVPLPLDTRGTQNSVVDPADISYSRGESSWRPWVDRVPFQGDFAEWPFSGIAYAQPILSDIETDGDDLIVSFMDRWGHQMGSNANFEDWTGTNGGVPYILEQPISSGDLVRAVGDGTGGYSFPRTGPDYVYTGDNYEDSHAETTLGGVVQLPGRPYTISASFDPIEAPGTWQSGGLEWFDNTSGEHVAGYRLYDGRNAIESGTFEKAAGIGDVEALCGALPIQIGDRAWFDVDGDGLQDPDEPGMGGILLELVEAAESDVLATTATDNSGRYVFDDVAAGVDYLIRVAETNYQPGGVFAPGGIHDDRSVLTTNDVAFDGEPADQLDSDAQLASDRDGVLPIIPVNTDVTSHTFDLGFVSVDLGGLDGVVFVDSDEDGGRDEGERGIADVIVRLLSSTAPAGSAGSVIGETTTDADGRYDFGGLVPGEYVVAIPGGDQVGTHSLDGKVWISEGDSRDREPEARSTGEGVDPALADGYIAISEPVAAADLEDPSPDGLSATGGEADRTGDFGFADRFSVGNLVWLDADGNGVIDSGERGIPGVPVMLFDVQGGLPASPLEVETTDSEGRYRFSNLEAGNYRIGVEASQLEPGAPLDGVRPTVAIDAARGGDGIDNDGIPDTIGSVPMATLTPIFGLGPGGPTGETDANSGESAAFPIADERAVADGHYDTTIDLGFVGRFSIGDSVWRDLDADGRQDPDEPGIGAVPLQLWSVDADDSSLHLLAETTTDGSGRYEFRHIWPGTFRVGIPDSATVGTNALAGLTSTAAVDEGIGGDSYPDLHVDGDDDGVVAPGFASLSQHISIGSHQLNITTGQEGATADADRNFAVDFGFVPGLELEGLISNDVDSNGVNDPDEAGIPGVILSLIDAANGVPVAATTTNTDGRYRFTGLRPGEYRIEVDARNFISGGPAQGLWPSDSVHEINGATDGADGEAEMSGGGAPWVRGVRSDIVSLVSRPEPSADAGAAGVAAEDSIPTLDVSLYSYSLGDQVWADADNNGRVDPGEDPREGVVLQLLDERGDPVKGPDGTPRTTKTDENGSYGFDGLRAGTYSVVVPALNFAAGGPLEGLVSSNLGTVGAPAADPSDGVDADDNGAPVGDGSVESPPFVLTNPNSNLDFGFVEAASLESVVWVDTDEDLQRDDDEPGIPGVNVLVKSAADGSVVESVTTDSDGRWKAKGLEPGAYVVDVANSASSVTVQNTDGAAGGDNEPEAGADSGAGADAGVILLEPGENNPNVAIAMNPPVLAFTGSELTRWLLLLAILMVGSGSNMVLAERVRVRVSATAARESN